MAGKVLLKFAKNGLLQNNLTFSMINAWKINVAGYAVAKKGAPAGAKGGVSKKKKLEIETDAKILCTRLCGGNIYKEGEDPVLGPDEDYPDWLWDLTIEKTRISLDGLTEDDPKYWRVLKKLNMREKNKMRYAKRI